MLLLHLLLFYFAFCLIRQIRRYMIYEYVDFRDAVSLVLYPICEVRHYGNKIELCAPEYTKSLYHGLYRGYAGRSTRENGAGIHHGIVVGIGDKITFQGSSVRQATEEFHKSVDDYLEFCEQRGEEPAGRIVEIEFDPKLRALAIPEEGGGFSLVVPALEGCVSCCDTIEEARELIADAAEGWLESMHDAHAAEDVEIMTTPDGGD